MCISYFLLIYLCVHYFLLLIDFLNTFDISAEYEPVSNIL